MTNTRWKDSLPPTNSTDLGQAAELVIRAIICPDRPHCRICPTYLGLAGAVIRNARKAAPKPYVARQDERKSFYNYYTDDELLWFAMRHIAASHRDGVIHRSALRWAEAALRTYWKRTNGTA